MPEPMIKGGAIRAFFEWYQERHGIDHIRAMAKRAPEDLRAALDPEQPLVTILPASWYPARLVHAMLEAMKEDMTDAQFGELARAGNQTVIERSFGVYRFLLETLVTPEMYAIAVPRLWKQLHNTGTRKMTIDGPNEATSIVASWAGHHPLLCIIVIETMRAVFVRMGKKDVKWERVKCVSRHGGTECITKLTWR